MSTDLPAPAAVGFRDLGLPEPLLRALVDVGYETPSPIQAATIPPLLAGRDLLGQAQTGTGKTAAFALPLLARLDLARAQPQVLVLAPTRELAIQVAEAFQRYAMHLPGFHVLPIYGGQGYGPQLAGLKRGAHVVVGTPGRVIDHLERGTLKLDGLACLVLDEADEMLRMGFIDDVEKVFARTPPTRQVALFSATMPTPVRRIAQNHLRDPAEITIAARTTTAPNTRQRYWSVSGMHKLDALTRILEAEPFDAMLVFARTKQSTEELAGKLAARGFSVAAINGDVAQPLRERAVQQLKDGQIDILVATDVAARGLDVDRISHVLNYDIPYDTESYVHRIGRTGRAGRSGEAILFVAPRERGMLRAIERATRQPITPMSLPSVGAVNDRRIARFMQRIGDALAAGGLEPFQALVEQYEQAHNVPALEIAAALARIAQGDAPLLLEESAQPMHIEERPSRTPRGDSARAPRGDSARAPRDRDATATRAPAAHRARGGPTRERADSGPEAGFETYRIEVGKMHGVRPGNIVGAIANEAGLDSKNIGRLRILDAHSLIDLPSEMPAELLQHLRKVWVSGQQLRIARAADGPTPTRRADASGRPRSGPGGRPFKPKARPPR
ncbi:MAG TPA: DEAD/DEAH box helicase [Rhodanobacteraceae bacterium]|nr:DEAD/DEAH box helicase [Rhodanobacteraceae bacterium]